MDTSDARLFCLLRDCYFEPTSTSVRRPAHKDVAKMLQVDPRTVKERVRSWERRGFIKYYQLVPNHRLLGIRSTSFLLEVGDPLAKPKVLERISLVDGVTSVLDFLGEDLFVWVAYQDDEELQRRTALLGEISGSRRVERYLDEPFGPVDMKLTLLDWQIIRSMRNDAMKPVSRMAKELKVTRKTVRAHLERLVASNAFFVRTIFDVTRVKGLIFFGLDVTLEEEGREDALRELDAVVTCSVNCFVRMVTRSGRAFLALWAEDLQGVENSFLSARRIRGVKKVDLLLYKRVTEHPQFFDKIIEKKIIEATKRRSFFQQRPRGSR
ncbi:MAG: hypothetical protein HY296_07755 [Thaumarchaeota archaeon]|nr:hypothetical protein [Nitrososphaerota archaeon]